MNLLRTVEDAKTNAALERLLLRLSFARYLARQRGCRVLRRKTRESVSFPIVFEPLSLREFVDDICL